MTGVGPRVLVVDDVADAADSMAGLLALWGYDAAATYSGAAALRSVQLHRPAVILLDIGMAPMDGFAFTAQLRDLPGCREISVVAVSGYTSEAYQARGRELGIAHYLFKPGDPNRVQVLLGQLVALPEPVGAAASPARTRGLTHPAVVRRAACGST